MEIRAAGTRRGAGGARGRRGGGGGGGEAADRASSSSAWPSPLAARRRSHDPFPRPSIGPWL